MSKDLTTRSNIAPRESMPTPLMVAQRQDKSVTLKFTTQAEADIAWRILSALAEAHADRTWAERDAGIGYSISEETKKEIQEIEDNSRAAMHNAKNILLD